MLGIRIIRNNFLFGKVFDFKFFGLVPFMNETWPKKFEVSLEDAKAEVSNPRTNISNFGPLSLCFKH